MLNRWSTANVHGHAIIGDTLSIERLVGGSRTGVVKCQSSVLEFKERILSFIVVNVSTSDRIRFQRTVWTGDRQLWGPSECTEEEFQALRMNDLRSN